MHKGPGGRQTNSYRYVLCTMLGGTVPRCPEALSTLLPPPPLSQLHGSMGGLPCRRCNRLQFVNIHHHLALWLLLLADSFTEQPRLCMRTQQT